MMSELKGNVLGLLQARWETNAYQEFGMVCKNLYAVLGVSPMATRSEINAAICMAIRRKSISRKDVQLCQRYLLDGASRIRYNSRLQADYPNIFDVSENCENKRKYYSRKNVDSGISNNSVMMNSEQLVEKNAPDNIADKKKDSYFYDVKIKIIFFICFLVIYFSIDVFLLISNHDRSWFNLTPLDNYNAHFIPIVGLFICNLFFSLLYRAEPNVVYFIISISLFIPFVIYMFILNCIYLKIGLFIGLFGIGYSPAFSPEFEFSFMTPMLWFVLIYFTYGILYFIYKRMF